MKKLIIILLVAVLCGFFYVNNKNKNAELSMLPVYQAQADDGTPFSVEISLPDWEKVYFTGNQMYYTANFIPPGESKKNWKKLVTVKFYNSTQNYFPESYYNEYIEELNKEAKKFNSQLDTNLIKTSTNDVIFEWTIKGKSMSEMCRLYRTDKGLYIIQYTIRNAVFDDEKERENVIKTLKSLKEKSA